MIKKSAINLTFSFFVIGLLISLFLSNIYLSSSVIAPTRDNYQADSGSNVGGILASTIGFRSDEATPELKFAGTYLSSYKFLSNFIVKNDLVDELLRFRKYNKSDGSLVLKKEVETIQLRAYSLMEKLITQLQRFRRLLRS